MSSKVRREGVKRAIVGLGVGTALVMTIFGYNDTLPDGRHLPGLVYWAAAVPGGYGVAGLLQGITGRPFQETARAWDSLAGWQRGVIGLLVVTVAVALMFAAMMLSV